jgi:pyrimidine operon attenuation protein/uracil phosphoribosyltransferase
MPKNSNLTPNIREILPASKVSLALSELTANLMKEFDFSKSDVALIGIQSRGVILANRIAHTLKTHHLSVPVGALDITLYRDDFSTAGINPVIGETHLDFDINGKQIVLVDDVLFTGRTVRAAMDQLIDFGRPKSITLFVLVDRGHRELPIAAHFAPIKITTKRTESVNLHLEELDGKDEIVVYDPVE